MAWVVLIVAGLFEVGRAVLRRLACVALIVAGAESRRGTPAAHRVVRRRACIRSNVR